MSYYKNQYVPTTVEASTSQSTVDALLDTETANNRAEPWNKLNKTMKIQKINAYATKYAAENNVAEEELRKFLMNCLDKSRLQNTKDIKYDKVKQEIVGIPALTYNTSGNKFTLKNMEPSTIKRVATLKRPKAAEASKTPPSIINPEDLLR
jgi:GH25 family lysozyme M1 (1,4-beta-N-acetylmuramidase)